MEEKKHFNIRITGRVQGVGFRHSALSRARTYGIKGFVKNMTDGSVYIEAEGTEEALEQFINWCRKGPGMGRVENVQLEKDNPGNYSEFSVRH